MDLFRPFSVEGLPAGPVDQVHPQEYAGVVDRDAPCGLQRVPPVHKMGDVFGNGER